MIVIEDRLGTVVRSSDSPTERVFDSEVVPATELVSASSIPPPVSFQPLVPKVSQLRTFCTRAIIYKKVGTPTASLEKTPGIH